MKRSMTHRIFRALLAVSVVLPFFAFSKEALATLGGPLVWLLGYPFLVAIILTATAEPGHSKRIHATRAQTNKGDAAKPVTETERSLLHERINSPKYNFLSSNIHHR